MEIKYTPIRKGKFLDQIETETRNANAEAYSARCRQKRIEIDWQSESSTMYAIAGVLLLLLTTAII